MGVGMGRCCCGRLISSLVHLFIGSLLRHTERAYYLVTAHGFPIYRDRATGEKDLYGIIS